MERSVTHAKGPRSAYRTIARAFMAAARTRAGKTNLPSLLRLKRPLLMCFLRGRTASTVDEKASLLLLGLRLRVDVSDSSRGLSGICDARCSSGQRSDARVGQRAQGKGQGGQEDKRQQTAYGYCVGRRRTAAPRQQGRAAVIWTANAHARGEASRKVLAAGHGAAFPRRATILEKEGTRQEQPYTMRRTREPAAAPGRRSSRPPRRQLPPIRKGNGRHRASSAFSPIARQSRRPAKTCT